MSGRYQSYQNYKDSKVEWVDRYPSDWVLAKVKFESYVKARVGWHGLKSDDFTDEGPYLITGSDFKGKNIDWQNCYHCDEERYKQDPYIQLKEGDLLITKDGTIGKIVMVNNLDGKATLNSGVFVVRPLMGNYSTSFYYWLLQSAGFTGFVDYNKTGSTIVHLYQDTFVNFMYASPSLPEQKAIANFLDHETAKIDFLINKQQELIKLLNEKRQAVISHAITKGLNPDASMKDSGVEWLGEVPEHWVVAKLKYLVDDSAAGPYGASLTKTMYTISGYRVYGQQQVIAGNLELGDYYISKEKYAEMERYRVYPDDVLISVMGTVGKVAVVPANVEPGIINPRLVRYAFNKKRVLPEFVKMQISSISHQDYLLKAAQGSTMDGLNMGILGGMSLAFPKVQEQQRIIDQVKKVSEEFSRLISFSEKSLELLQERRTALISAAVTGKIDVRNWQPAQTVTPMEANA